MKEAWQRFYFRGEMPDDTGPAPKAHVNKRRLKAAEAAASEPRSRARALPTPRALCDKPPPSKGRPLRLRSAGVAQG